MKNTLPDWSGMSVTGSNSILAILDNVRVEVICELVNTSGTGANVAVMDVNDEHHSSHCVLFILPFQSLPMTG